MAPSRFWSGHRLKGNAGGIAFIAAVGCCLCIVIFSIPQVRTILAAPLVVHDANARGDACYVLAGGGSIWERLDAAADLVQMGRISRIFIMKDNNGGPYSFKAGRSWKRAEWIVDYLSWRGISPDRITWIPATEQPLGTLAEAQVFAQSRPKNLRTLVVVSSAPHMRRSVLAFRRSLPPGVQIVPYAATEFKQSYEMHHPLWIEYFKLLVYSISVRSSY